MALGLNMVPRPTFVKAWAAFQLVNKPPVDVGKYLGGKVEFNFVHGYFQNACATRLSHVLNSCGVKIPKDGVYAVVSDKKGEWFIFRYLDLRIFLIDVWGPPSIMRGKPLSETELHGRRGVLLFDGDDWDDASGHATLWDTYVCADHGFFDQAKSYLFWDLP